MSPSELWYHAGEHAVVPDDAMKERGCEMREERGEQQAGESGMCDT